ncbi:MAG: FAD-binding oxidoreductase [Burkholderiaceae bacterium]
MNGARASMDNGGSVPLAGRSGPGAVGSASPTEWPERVSVVVIGGGIVGVCTALSLARWGVSVALLEKGRVAAEQSSRNWGWVRMQGRDRAEVPLMLESRRQWAGIVPALDIDIGFRRIGCTYLAPDANALALQLRFLATAREFGLDTHAMAPAALAGLLGPIGVPVAGGLHTPSDCCAEPSLAVPAMARLAARLGASVFEHTAVRRLLLRQGRVVGVATEHGPIACDEVVLAGGVWSRSFLENHGLGLPQLGVISSAQRTTPVALPFATAVNGPGVAMRKRLDGGATIARVSTGRFELIPAAFSHFKAFQPVRRDPGRTVSLHLGRSFFGPLGRHRWGENEVSPFERLRIMDPTPDARLLDDILASARRLLPAFRDARPAERWAGMIDVMPDEVPVIDRVAAIPGLTLATGFSGHGFGLGPGAGLLTAQIVAGREPCVPPEPFRLARFGG